jgi:hypothetical protein
MERLSPIIGADELAALLGSERLRVVDSRWYLGKRGAGYYAGGKFIVEPANLARRAVHSTGTGDVLSICMILLEANKDLSLRQKLRFSNQVVREFMEGRRSLIPVLQR